MKSIILLTVLITVFVSCNMNTNKSTTIIIEQKENIEQIVGNKFLYNIDNFKILSDYKFILEIQSDTLNSYSCKDLNSKVFYRVNVDILKNDLNEVGLNRFNKAFSKEFLRVYEGNLKQGNNDYEIVKYENRKALINNFIVTNNKLIGNQTAITKCKSLTFLNIDRAYTLFVIAEPDMIESIFKKFTSDFQLIFNENSDNFVSPKYKYKIPIPTGYVPAKATGSNIDFKIESPKGLMIINVSPRRPEEEGVTAHDYTKELIETIYKQVNLLVKVGNTKKNYIDKTKAFLVESVNPKKSISVLEVYFYKDNLAYLMTGRCKTSDYKICRQEFLDTFYSFKFPN